MVFFIGDFPADELNSIYTLLKKCLGEFLAFDIDFEAFTCFPPGKPRMIWAKGKPNRNFENLETSVFNTLKHFYAFAYMENNARSSKNPFRILLYLD
ncbi:MAG: hypothetical protein EOP53_07405 [Sphingobacteriales bacterium]|nr:MAG: hypothetical protein EOP53_07405 [Sphingobacteriales bacterium]